MPFRSREEIVEAARQAKLPPALASDIKSLLSDGGAMLWLIGEIEKLAAERARQFARMDFVSPEGQAKALQNQGELRGFDLVIDLILDTQEHEDGERSSDESR